MHQYRTHAAYFNLWLRLDQVVYMPSYNLNHVRSVRSVVERRGIVSSRFFPSNNHRKRYNHRNKLQIQFRLIETCGNIVKYLFKLPQKQTDKKKKRNVRARSFSLPNFTPSCNNPSGSLTLFIYFFFIPTGYYVGYTLPVHYRMSGPHRCEGEAPHHGDQWSWAWSEW